MYPIFYRDYVFDPRFVRILSARFLLAIEYKIHSDEKPRAQLESHRHQTMRSALWNETSHLEYYCTIEHLPTSENTKLTEYGHFYYYLFHATVHDLVKC